MEWAAEMSISQTAVDKVRERTEASMDAAVRILRGSAGVLDEATGLVSGMTKSAPVYEGKARLHTVVGQGSLSLGPGQLDQRSTTVSIPWGTAPVQRDDVVLVLSPGRDTQLTGAALRVVEVAGGGTFGDARRLSCTLWGKSAYWDGDGS